MWRPIAFPMASVTCLWFRARTFIFNNIGYFWTIYMPFSRFFWSSASLENPNPIIPATQFTMAFNCDARAQTVLPEGLSLFSTVTLTQTRMSHHLLLLLALGWLLRVTKPWSSSLGMLSPTRSTLTTTACLPKSLVRKSLQRKLLGSATDSSLVLKELLSWTRWLMVGTL